MMKPVQKKCWLKGWQPVWKARGPRPIIKFLNHQIDETAFAKEAMGYSRSTEVHFYLAMDQAQHGKIQDAINNLQWVKDNGDKSFYEYPVAIAQLERLQKHGLEPAGQ